MNIRLTAISLASLFGMSSVILGAIGAHALADSLDPKALDSFRTAVHYQQIHALALLGVGIWAGTDGAARIRKLLTIIMFIFAVGILLFSGSIYLMHLAGLDSLRKVTPSGGMLMILGWLLILPAAWLQRVPAQA